MAALASYHSFASNKPGLMHQHSLWYLVNHCSWLLIYLHSIMVQILLFREPVLQTLAPSIGTHL